MKSKKEIKEYFFNNQEQLEKLNDISNLVVLNNNKVQILTSLFFKKHKAELLMFFNPIWYTSKERLILTKKEIENSNNEIFNAYAERLNFEINEKIKNKRNEIDDFLISMVGLNSGKNKTKQNSIFPIDKNVIKEHFQGNLTSMISALHYQLGKLQYNLTDRGHFENFNIYDLKKTNLIIEETDIKERKKIFNINIGFKETTKIKTNNREKTKAYIQYAYIIRYLQELNELKKL